MKLRPEEKIQADIVNELRRRYECRVCHVPNGGFRSKPEAVRLKSIGVVAGHPDLVIYCPGAKTYLMEVKTEDGRESVQQEGFIGVLRNWAFPVAVVHSLDEAIRACDFWHLPPRRAESAPEGVSVRF